MALKTFSPRTAGLRGRVAQTFDDLTPVRPVRSLTESHKAGSGRNNVGRITVRHRGGGVKRRLRTVDFRRDKSGIPARVVAISYDPNRSANLADRKSVV